MEKEQFWKLLKNFAEDLTTSIEHWSNQSENFINKIQKAQLQLERVYLLMSKLKEDTDIHIKLEDYLQPDELQIYHDSLTPPQMLCDFDITFKEWLEWFYDELPFIATKHLVFNDGTQDILLKDIDTALIIKVDHVMRKIYLQPDNDHFNSVIFVNLDGLDLYYLLSVTHQKSIDEHISTHPMTQVYEYE